MFFGPPGFFDTGLPLAEKPTRAAKAAPTFTPRERTVAKRIVNERFKDAPRHLAPLPAPLAGLLQSLPAEGDTWTEDERAKFLATFTPVLDFCFQIEEAEEETDSLKQSTADTGSKTAANIRRR